MAKPWLHLQNGLTRSKLCQKSRKKVKFRGFRQKSKIRPGHRVVLTKNHIFLVLPVIHVQIKVSRLLQAWFMDFGAKWKSLGASPRGTEGGRPLSGNPDFNRREHWRYIFFKNCKKNQSEKSCRKNQSGSDFFNVRNSS